MTVRPDAAPGEDEGQIVTVEGAVDPDEVGPILPHEHVFGDFSDKIDLPVAAVDRKRAREPFSLETLSWIRDNIVSHEQSLRLDSLETAIEEVGYYHRAGGDLLVDVTPKNVGGDPRRVRAVARETDVRIVHGTAFYVHYSHPDRVEAMTPADIADEFASDVLQGIGDTDVRAGVIGEVGASGEIRPEEEKVIRGGARAARRTGAALSIHPPFHRDEEAPTSKRALWCLDIAEEEGLSPDRIVLCHRDQSKWLESDLRYQKEIADRGAYVEFDLFGHPEAYHEIVDDAQPSDLDRVRYVEKMVEAGYADRLLLSHDVFVKTVLRMYGGNGYAHLLENIVPLLRTRGVDDATIRTLLTENPKRVLTFATPDPP
jgi:phosphotriesterase-related protein